MLSAAPITLPSLALLPEAAVTLGRDGRVLAASPPACEMFLLDPRGSALEDLVVCTARLWAAVEGIPVGGHVALVPLEGVRADGVPFALDVSVRVLEGRVLLCLLRELDRHATSSL